MTSRPCDICRIYLEHQFSVHIEQFDINIYFYLRSIVNGTDNKISAALRNCVDLMKMMFSGVFHIFDCLDSKLLS